MNCSMGGCRLPADWKVALHLRVVGDDPCALEWLRLRLPVYLCEAHRSEERLLTILSLAGGDWLEEALGEIKLTNVNWGRSALRFIALDED